MPLFPKSDWAFQADGRIHHNTRGGIWSSPVLIIVVIACFVLYSHFETEKEDNLSYDSLLTSLNNKEVEKLEMETGSYTVKAIMKGEGSEEERTETVVVPSIQAFMELVNTKIDEGVFDVEIEQTSPNQFLSIMGNVVTYIPTIMLIVLIFLIFKMQGFGKSDRSHVVL